MAKNEQFNRFQVIGTCQTELIEETDAHGKKNHTLQIKTSGEFPVEVRVHFYSLSAELIGIPYKGHKVKVNGSLQGKMYANKNGEMKEWLQLRGSFITLCDEETSEPLEDMNTSIITEDDLPF